MMRTKMISLFCKRTIFSIAITLFLILLPRLVFSQTSQNHPVTVTTTAVNIIQINGGNIALNIAVANATAGVDQMSSLPNQISTLIWGTNSTPRKITIRTNLTPQKYTLKAVAINPTVGTEASEVTLSTTDQNFITGIGCSSGNASVRYTGIALASKGIGMDSHTITFTITP
jgi:hypothetical protein